MIAFKLHINLIDKFTLLSYHLSWINFCKKCCNCYSCSYQSCGVACCIDSWHYTEVCGLAYLFFSVCYRKICVPLCIYCKLGDGGKAMEHFSKGIKYYGFACALNCTGCFDGLYNCVKIISQVYGWNILVTFYAELTKNAKFIGNKVK